MLIRSLKINVALAFFLVGFLTGCGKSSVETQPEVQRSKSAPGHTRPYQIDGKYYYPMADASGFYQKGIASWYGKDFHGRKTSNGEVYNMYAMTAAHKTLPMNTWVRVTNLENKKEIVVRINDRGPFVDRRIIDLSYTGASKLGIVGPGTARVKIVALGRASKTETSSIPKTFTPVDYFKGDFTVQVGAFMEKSNAESFRTRLASRYDNAHITTYSDSRGEFFRVRVGRFTDLRDAERFTQDLEIEGSESAFVVAE